MANIGHFSPRAARVLELAGSEARELGHGYLGTEHLLLGLIREGEGPVARALLDSGITSRSARTALETVTGPTPPPTEVWTGLTPAANEALRRAISDSLWLGHHYNGTEHILLALLKSETSVAIDMLHHLAADEDALADAAIAAGDPHRDAELANPAVPWDDRFPLPSAPPEQDPLRRQWAETRKRFAGVDRAIRAVCRQEVKRLNHGYVGTEHALLGILAAGDPLTTAILARRGVTWEQAAAAVDDVIGRGEGDRLGEIGPTGRILRISSGLIAESASVGQELTGHEHLLRHLLSHEHGAAISTLRQLQVDLEALRAEMSATAPLPGSSNTVLESDPNPEQRASDNRTFDVNALMLRHFKGKAREEAKRLRHATAGTEHFLLGIVRAPDRFIWDLLPEVGLTRAGTRRAVEELFPPGGCEVGTAVAISPHFQRALASAERERERRSQGNVRSYDVLLALLDDASCRAAKVIDRLGIDRERFRSRLTELRDAAEVDRS